jgi:hypothetical protein
MPTLNLATDAFRQSAKAEFYESPKHERGGPSSTEGEAAQSKTYTSAGSSINIGWVRLSNRPSGTFDNGTLTPPSRFSSGFKRQRYVYHNGDSSISPYGDQTGTWFVNHQTKFAALEADHGDYDNPASFLPDGYPVDASEIITDTDTAVHLRVTYTNGSTIDQYFDEPYTYADALDDAIAIYTAKFTAWTSTSITTNENWTYDTSGAIVAGLPAWPGWGELPAEGGLGFGSLGADTDTSQIVYFGISASRVKYVMSQTYLPLLDFYYDTQKTDWTTDGSLYRTDSYRCFHIFTKSFIFYASKHLQS